MLTEPSTKIDPLILSILFLFDGFHHIGVFFASVGERPNSGTDPFFVNVYEQIQA